jgi:hypothetical protein
MSSEKRSVLHRGTAHAAVTLLLSIGPLAWTQELEPLSGSALRALCESYEEPDQSANGRVCAAYVLGFLEGFFAPETRSAPNDSFAERAFSTRVGAHLDRTRDCTDRGISVQQLVADLMTDTSTRPADEDASTALYLTLRRLSRCTPAQPASSDE